jgi:hypothetical protein
MAEKLLPKINFKDMLIEEKKVDPKEMFKS